MRGSARRQAEILTVRTPGDLVPPRHPLRRVKPVADAVLESLSSRLDTLYSRRGRPSTPPEHLLKATLLMALYSISSHRQFSQQLGYNLIFKWFLDLNIADRPFNAATFSKNRKRLFEQEVSATFFAEVVGELRRLGLLAAREFRIDHRQLERWAPPAPLGDGTRLTDTPRPEEAACRAPAGEATDASG